MNKIGWSQYSPIAYVLAATVPEAPLRPTLEVQNTASVVIGISRSHDNRGSPILRYRLYVDSGNDFSSSFAEVTTYGGLSETHEVTVSSDNLVTGYIYRFKLTCENEFGASDFSQETIIGVGA